MRTEKLSQASFIILSPYFGPLIAAFIISTQKWQWAFGVYTIMTGLCLIVQVLFAEESFYNRKLSSSERIPRRSRLQRLVGIEQWHSRRQRSTFRQAVMRPIRVILKPTVFLSTIYYLFTFAWVVGINTTLAIFVTPLYDFGPKQIGYFYFTPIIAAVLGEVAGHWLHDMIARVLTRRNKGVFEPEFRLAVIWLSTPFILAGLIVLGFALQRAWHYMIAALGWYVACPTSSLPSLRYARLLDIVALTVSQGPLRLRHHDHYCRPHRLQP